MPLFKDASQLGGIGTDASFAYPEIFWTNLVKNGQGLPGGGTDVSDVDPGNPIGALNFAKTFEKYRNGTLPEVWRQHFEKALRSVAEQLWDNLPEAEKAEWHSAQEKGFTEPVGSDAGIQEQKEYEERGVREDARLDFEGWEEDQLADLESASAAAAAGDSAALTKMEEILAGIENPELAAYVGDYVSQAAQAAPSQEAIERQKAAFDKTWALTDVRETAEEKLMREMARRQQEQDLRAQRGAFANDLQARGVYGSGAELTMNLAASQEAANRRAIDEMMANANAQQRAMLALEQAGGMSTDIRDAEAQESQFRGTAADIAARFNKNRRVEHDQWVANELRKNNNDTIFRGQTVVDNRQKFGRNLVSDAQTIAGTSLQGVGAKANTSQGMSALVGGTIDTRTNIANAEELKDTIT